MLGFQIFMGFASYLCIVTAIIQNRKKKVPFLSPSGEWCAIGTYSLEVLLLCFQLTIVTCIYSECQRAYHIRYCQGLT